MNKWDPCDRFIGCKGKHAEQSMLNLLGAFVVASAAGARFHGNEIQMWLQVLTPSISPLSRVGDYADSDLMLS